MEPWDIVFFKRLESKLHTFTANAVATPYIIKFEKPEDFLEYVKSIKKRDTVSDRFKVLEQEAHIDPTFGRYCVRLFLKSEDHAAPNVDAPILILEIHDLTCVHPDTPDWVISVGYSERYEPGRGNAELNQVGEQFLKSLQFMPIE
ncbi:MAG: hypothetical protein HY200_01940 [Nitrospirae bacterium]|nr:hypothetical protein [Nitrospirota bacterium]